MRLEVIWTADEKTTALWDVAQCNLGAMMGAVRTSETSIYLRDYTELYPKGCNLRI
jgi:hypothetical protein